MVDETRNTTPSVVEPAKREDVTSLVSEFFEHQRKAAEQTLKALNALIPPDFKTYSREAGKEFLASFKVLYDGASEALTRELDKVRKPTVKVETPVAPVETQERPKTTGKNKVKVEVG